MTDREMVTVSQDWLNKTHEQVRAQAEVIEKCREAILSLRTVVILGYKNPEVINWGLAEKECEQIIVAIDALGKEK